MENYAKSLSFVPTMKSLDADKKTNKTSEAAPAAAEKVAEKIDFSNVKIEPIFEEMVDFDTFSKSDFRAVKILACEAVPKSKKLLKFTLDDGERKDRVILRYSRVLRAGRTGWKDSNRYREPATEKEDRKSTRLNSSHNNQSRMPSSA